MTGRGAALRRNGLVGIGALHVQWQLKGTGDETEEIRTVPSDVGGSTYSLRFRSPAQPRDLRFQLPRWRCDRFEARR